MCVICFLMEICERVLTLSCVFFTFFVRFVGGYSIVLLLEAKRVKRIGV